MNLWLKIALLAGIQISALAAMIADKQWTLNTGVPVILQTEPVDPRSMFMGDFARLAYPISRLHLDGESALGGDKDFKRYDTVWVALKPDPNGAKAISVYHQRSDIPSGLLPLKGEVQYSSEFEWDRTTNKSVKQRTLNVRYGIEQYYVQEGTGRQIERPQGGEKVSMLVAIDNRGKAGILAVMLNGHERYRETLF
ncbi:GDYXXLXY domain-containing protein [Sulfurirhabdus autotrophica]|uniref:Putative membrane-anchored protein n=1 Tax=Sulfurirhabdus autotrophica TaxID=1706046 RepID=A0A4R3Y7A1_9PROT|nr:GDYXXLXY domain-containing protein [Sulfurirhabdus autotrophica]TCV86404.1 putative membrane-anchored protein [Sulfurirhabdus autotrophica]